MNAEPVLFIDNRQPQFGEHNPLLKQRVGAHQQMNVTRSQPFQQRPPGLAGQPPGQPRHFNP